MCYLNRYQRGQCWYFSFKPAGFSDAALIFPETHPFKEKVVVDVMLSREGGDAAVFFKRFDRHAHQPELKFGRLVLAC